jgi:hypothetical protein
MPEPKKLQQFSHWLHKLTQGRDRVAFKLVNGDALSLHKPFHFGSDFVAGGVSAGSVDRMAVRFEAIAAVRGQDMSGNRDEAKRVPEGEQVQ